MAQIRLVFTKPDGEGNGHSVRVDYLGRDGQVIGGEAQPFNFELDAEDYTNLRWYLEEFMDLPDGGSLIRASRIEQSLASWGRNLYKAVFDHGDHRDRIGELLQVKQTESRLLTIATSDADILRLPWELMENERGALFGQGVTIRRQLETAKKKLKYQLGSPLRVLLIVSRPDDTGFIDPRHSTRAMVEALTSLQEDVVIDFCRPPTLARLERMLAGAAEAGEPYTIVHFDGHGDYCRALGLGVLFFEQAQQVGAAQVQADPVRADTLGNLLAAHDIPLVMLEACRTSEVGTLAFRSVAPRLIEAGVGSVLAMSYAVHVEAAKILIERFYRELVAGRTIGRAMEGGRTALLANQVRWLERGPGARTIQLTDWFLPQLYQRGDDLTLVTKSKRKARRGGADRKRVAIPTGQDVGAFPRPPIHGFYGRAAELYKLERAFRLDRAVLLHAMGGMGKTSLAREAAAWLTETGLFAGGACFISFEQPTTPERVIQVLGTYLEGHAFEQLSEDEQRTRARELFDTRRVLMVWDNFESVLPAFGFGASDLGSQEGPCDPADDTRKGEQDAPNPQSAIPNPQSQERTRLLDLFRDLTESPNGQGRLLVTCRPVEAGLVGVRRMELSGLARPDSLYLLATVMRKHDLSLDDERFPKEKLGELLSVLADHPLSIELVGPHLTDRTPETIVADFDKLLAEFTGDADVERNRSLLASLRFSTDRLSQNARAGLSWLGLFRGGVFEINLLDVSEIEPDAWDAVRAELEATALVRVEREIEVGDRPYLRFHPTLAYATAAVSSVRASEASSTERQTIRELRDPEAARRRFVAVYGALHAAIEKALRGSNPRAGMGVLAREEANFRAAVRWAIDAEAYDVAGPMGGTFGQYLQMSGRLRERDQWVNWLAKEAKTTKFSLAAAAAEQQAAWSLFTQGRAADAVERLEAIIERLKQTTEFDAAFSLATARHTLGRVYLHAGHAALAIRTVEGAVRGWERLSQHVDAGGKGTETARGNLAAALGDLANAFQAVGRLDKAMSVAERGIEIHRELGHDRDIATGLGRTASILTKQGRYREADARYEEGLKAARRVGDKGLEGAFLQHRGILADAIAQHDRATAFYKDSLKLFQDANDEEGVMQTCNLLAVTDQRSGRLAEARAWYERSREIAKRRKDRVALAGAAHNIGIVCQEEGEAARKSDDEQAARKKFAEAERFVQESLRAWLDVGDRPREAMSHGQLAQLYRLAGELDKAEEHAHGAREIFESLGLKEVHIAYNDLARIARARGDEAGAAEWERKRDEARAELNRRATGGDAGEAALPDGIIKAVTELAVLCVQAGVDGSPLPPQADSVIQKLEESSEHPLKPIAPLLRALAAGNIPKSAESLPADLPGPLRPLFAQLIEAANEARRPE